MKSIRFPKRAIFTLGAALAFSGLCETSRAAIAVGDSDVQIGGFFSQGWLYANNNNFPTADKGGTWDFREMAFNVSDTIGAHLRVGAQAFAQSFGNIGDDKVILDWAIADYNFSPYFGIRAGRVKYPKGLYGEALDLDVVRPFIFLPGSVYSPILRDFSASFDGAMAYGSVNAFKGSFDYKVFGGNIPITPQKGVAEFYDSASFYGATGVSKLTMGSVEGLQLVWNTPVSGLKFVYSYSFFSNLESDGPFIAYPAANLHSDLPHPSYNTYSAEYTVGNWVFASEWQRFRGYLYIDAAPVLATTGQNVGWDGWYLSAARRFGDKIQVGAYYGALTDLFAAPTSAPGNHQYDTAVCIRYDYNDHVTFKVEGHLINGDDQTFNTVRTPNPTPSENNTVVAFKTTLSF
jgi:hypothetical protein